MSSDPQQLAATGGVGDCHASGRRRPSPPSPQPAWLAVSPPTFPGLPAPPHPHTRVAAVVHIHDAPVARQALPEGAAVAGGPAIVDVGDGKACREGWQRAGQAAWSISGSNHRRPLWFWRRLTRCARRGCSSPAAAPGKTCSRSATAEKGGKQQGEACAAGHARARQGTAGARQRAA